jgi:Zn-dependent protease
MLNVNCQKCGQDVLMPFHCPYCGGQFCSQHRLPENHGCPRIGVAHNQRQETVADVFAPRKDSYQFSVSFGQPRKVNGRVYFSPKELQHLAIGALLVSAVGFSYGLGVEWNSIIALELSALAALLTLSFFAHEIAHKVVAQKSGLWAEFRLTTWGALVTALTLLSPFKLISPGAVMISGPARLEDIGKISIAGPTTNIILSTIFLSAYFIPSPYSWIFAIGAFLNGFIAIFNLVPFGILDGYKIYSWNKTVWAVGFTASAVLAVVGYLIYP